MSGQTSKAQGELKKTPLGKIPDSWGLTTAEEFCVKVADGTHATPKPTKSGKFLVTSKHIKGGRVDLSSAYKISEEEFNEINKRSKVDQWDVLLSMIGTVGEIALIDHVPDFAIKNVGLFKCGKESKAKWLYYFLRGKIGQDEIRRRMAGTTQSYITLGGLRTFSIIFPRSEAELRAITVVLSSIDDKIKLLREQNKTLEAIAQAIFREWFVKFNFPGATGRMVDSELGEIPEGWRVRKLANLVNLTIGRTPPRKEPEWFSFNPNDVKWLSIKDLGKSGTYVLKTSEFLTRDAIEKHRMNVVPKNTVVISFKLTVGRVAITLEEMTTNEAIAHLRLSQDSEVTAEFLYLFFKAFDFNSIGSTSSIATAFNSKSLRVLDVLVPARDIVQKFDQAIKPIFKKIANNIFQIQTLSSLRDVLLPKLMKGEVRVKGFNG
jgi:type I restriction enzyme S subunit